MIPDGSGARSIEELAARLKERGILINPLNDPHLGPGYMRITTSLPEDNERFVAVIKELLLPMSESGR